ncbi:hypothetical protein GM3709_952 [Geminocystis sp. NIES-3709]|nr:hypothetical protein GM3709_952 [Geminocystis sp. NIES-3709]
MVFYKMGESQKQSITKKKKRGQLFFIPDKYNISNSNRYNTLSKNSKINNQISNEALHKTLLRMMSNDQKAVKRLITNLKTKYPNQTEIWYWEKAISDLERDRR